MKIVFKLFLLILLQYSSRCYCQKIETNYLIFKHKFYNEYHKIKEKRRLIIKDENDVLHYGKINIINDSTIALNRKNKSDTLKITEIKYINKPTVFKTLVGSVFFIGSISTFVLGVTVGEEAGAIITAISTGGLLYSYLIFTGRKFKTKNFIF